MKIAQQVRDEPHGRPVPNLGVRVRRKRDGVTLATVTTDANGIATIQGDGHYPPFYLQTTNQVGGPRVWRSDDTMAAGAFSPAEVPYALRAFGDGYIQGLMNNLVPSLSGTTVSLDTGGALVAGYPVINYTADTFSITRPSSGTRVDRLVARLYGEAHEDHGSAEFAILAGTVDAGTPALTQTTSVYEVSLATITVPSAGSLALVDDRVTTLAMLSRKPPVTGVARSSSLSTANTSGVALLSLDLSLTQSATYDIEAEFSGYQASVTSSTYPWEYSYGSFGAGSGQFNQPVDMAISPDGTKVYVADYANNRLVYLSYSGGVLTWQSEQVMPSVTGVCTDSSGNVYTVSRSGATRYITKWNATISAMTLQTSTASPIYGIATDNTNLYFTSPGTGEAYKASCSAMIFTTSTAGWGQVASIEYLNGALYLGRLDTGLYRGSITTLGTTATLTSNEVATYGITTDGTDLYITGSNRIRKINTSGTELNTFGSFGSGPGQMSAPRAIAIDPTGDVWVVDYGNNRLQRFASGTVLGGYGSVAVSIAGNVCPYIGCGASNGTIGNAHTRSVAGPATVTVAAYGKAIADTVVLNGCVLSARAVPRL